MPSLVAIGLLSALVLYLEMLLVRWVGTEIRVFAYLQNGVLVAAFLGLGLGLRNARRPARLLPALAAVTTLAFVIRDPWAWGLARGLTEGLTAFQDSLVWERSFPLAAEAFLHTALVYFSISVSLGLIACIALTFQPLGQWLGRWMDAHPRPIAAYSANLVGSLVGIALFLAATVARTPPTVWLVLAGLGLAACAPLADEGRFGKAAAVGLALALPLFAWQPTGSRETTWSPYQKLSVGPQPAVRPAECGDLIEVNNIAYQVLDVLDPARLAADPVRFPTQGLRLSHYMFPHALVGPRRRVLIVGGGAGNDASAALAAGAESVDVVEIDPAIVEMGRQRHPDRPYASERVRVIVDDARAYFRRSEGQYDLIWFGLVDSVTTPSAYTNVRLDNYLYTQESFAEVKRLLSPSGVAVVLFAPEAWWITDRLIGLMKHSFGHAPLAGFVARPAGGCLATGALTLVSGSSDALAAVQDRVAADAELRPHVRSTDETAGTMSTPTTDDWPYLHLPKRAVPRYHQLVAAVCLALGIVLRRRLFRTGDPVDVRMLMLGAGFMLLEVTGVSRAALLYGTTWAVNAYVVGGILLMALLANLTASRMRVDPQGWAFGGLLLSLALLALVPVSWLGSLPFGSRVLAGAVFLSLPVYFSGLVFVSAWSASDRKDLALGSNLLGALLGGIATLLSMLVGFQALVFITAACYLGAFLSGLRGRAASPVPVAG